MDIPNADRRHPWLRFELMGLTQGAEEDYLRKLRRFYHRKVFSVPILDFGSVGQVNGGNAAARLRDRLEMIHRGDEDHVLFRSHAWSRLFGIEKPLVRVLMLEFFCTVHYRETETDLEAAGAIVFRLGGISRSMTMRQFILAFGLHTEEEMASPGFAAYWTDNLRVVPDRGLLGDYLDRISSGGDSTTTTPSYTLIREPMRRLCHRLIALSIEGQGRSPEKVTTLDLFLLRSMDEGPVVNIPHFLAHYLHQIALGRDCGSKMTGGHFVSRLARHFEVFGGEDPAGFEVDVTRLPAIDADYLVTRLGICESIMGSYYWVPLGPVRQVVD